MSHRGGRHRSRRGRHCACVPCRERRAAKPKAEHASMRPAPPRNDIATQVLWGLAGELRTLGQERRGNGGRWAS
ncbi:hypothetical protein JD77_02565 [Micromonospora olivasterospora]|uniref:Uncharacterized protein n=1 Tax=Micromonospora olivasterospora TaxID=1880 RepID=A0A562IA44_MICOL|nr:hypothetical protein JD77_02565 [Micromonospora olivasterospora]